VLPFANPGGDPEREYFADGVTEELTAALTHVRWFSVAARNSAFTYKGRPVDVRQVGRELGVRYVLEGSVRKAGGQVRISCRLAEADAGGQVWAERFEGAYGDIFALQDRVAAAVAGAVEPSISRAEVARVRAKPTESLDAYDLYLRALPHHYCLTRRDNDAALALLRRAIALDPAYALAKGLLGSCHALRVMQGWLEPSDREEAVRLAREVLAGARDEPRALAYAARTLGYVGRERELALAAAERAVALNANSAIVLGIAGWISLYGGSPTVAAERFRRAIQLSPLDPEMAAFLAGLAYAHLRTREYEEALAFGLRAIREMPERATCHRAVIAALSCLGRRDEAAAAAARYRELVGPAGFHVFAERVSAVTADQEFTAMMIRSLREAGVPE
jgi:TolB-like protein/Tfp pilus assembly protein PilF